MRNIVIGVVVAVAIAGGVYVWLGDQGAGSQGENTNIDIHPLVVELVAPVKTKLKKSSTGNPIGYNPKMVSVTVTLRFTDEEAMERARGEMKQLRRAYGNTIGKYLTNREKSATDDISATIRARVAKTTDELFGAGVVAAFDVEGQFDEPTAK